MPNWTKDQLAQIETYRNNGFGEGYIAWMYGCKESELPQKQTPKNPKKKNPNENTNWKQTARLPTNNPRSTNHTT